MHKKMVTAGLAAGLLAGTGAGLILQMTGSAGAAGSAGSAISAVSAEGDDTTDTTGTTATADDSTDSSKPDPSTRLQEVLKPLVDDGTLTQAQLDSVISTLKAAGPMGGDHGDRGGRGGMGGAGLGVVATTLGMTEAEVRDAISNGQTLAQLAEAKGSSAQALIDALVAEMKAHLDEEVTAGEHTQAEADAKLADATTRITDFVNNTDTAGPMGGGMGGPGGHRGHGPDDADDTGTDDAATDATADATVTTTG
jgi:hypothetical protein